MSYQTQNTPDMSAVSAGQATWQPPTQSIWQSQTQPQMQQSAPPQAAIPAADPAVDMIRQKIRDLYAIEPDAAQEAAVIAQAPIHPGSRHQQYMQQLNASGASLADIQAAWHNYYVSLPDHEKYEVWQEFYVTNNASPVQQQFAAALQQPQPAAPVPASIPQPVRTRSRTNADRAKQMGNAVDQAVEQATAKFMGAAKSENVQDIKKRIFSSVSRAGKATLTADDPAHPRVKLGKKHHLQSLAFGLASGMVVVFIFLFSFFNEFLIAPFIQPSRQSGGTPVIVDPVSTVVSGGPKILIPKINVEIPVDYSQTTTDEKAIELALDKGIVHYPTTQRPGQAGNAAFFGHSSNNIFNPGKYKFAFVLLHKLETGDIFYLTDGSKTFAYQVFSKRVVQPSEVGVLNPIPGKNATATLITCDPPGTSINRLVVVGEQISPDPGGNAQPTTAPPVQTAAADTSDLPGNGPTLWSRIWGTIF